MVGLFEKDFLSAQAGKLSQAFDQVGEYADEGNEDGHADDQEAPPGDASYSDIVSYLLFFRRLAHDGVHEGEAQEEVADGGGYQCSRQNP